MPNSPRTEFNEIDLTVGIANPIAGISWVEGITKRGPISDPSTIIRGWPQFEKIFGGLIEGNEFPLQCKRALEGGSFLRVNRLGHYTDVTDKTTLDAAKAGMIPYVLLKISAAFVSLNSITITINGVAIASPVVYTTSSDNTLSLLAAAILAHADVDYAEVVNPGTATTSDDRFIIFYKNSATPLTITAATVTLGASQPTITCTNETMFVDSNGANLFSLTPKNHGADYDNLIVTIGDASNGSANHFKITIQHEIETDIIETYDNLTIPGSPTVPNSKYLNDIVRYSSLMDVTYQDLSALTPTLRPRNGEFSYIGGDDGSSLTDNDYIGDQSQKNGMYAFDNYSDSRVLTTLNFYDDEVAAALSEYCENRGDVQHIQHLDNSANTADLLAADVDASGIDSSYTAFIAGGLLINHPVTSIATEIAEIGDYIGAIAYTETKFGYWRAIEGDETGKIFNCLGVVNNFGGPGSYNDANLLSNRGVNLAVNRDGVNKFWHNCTALKTSSDLQNLNVRFILIGMKKAIRPFAERFIGQPCEPTTWKKMYLKIKVYLDYLISVRAIYQGGWKYDGDQFATTPLTYTVNDPAEVSQGKYKARIYLKLIPAMQEIIFDLMLTPQGVTFEIASEL